MGAPTPLIDGLGCRGGLWSCEKIGIGRFPSLHHRKEGWPSDQRYGAKPPLTARPGRLSDENKWKTTPAASASVAARNFLDDAATPPCGRARRGITLDFNLFTAPMTAPTVANFGSDDSLGKATILQGHQSLITNQFSILIRGLLSCPSIFSQPPRLGRCPGYLQRLAGFLPGI